VDFAPVVLIGQIFSAAQTGWRRGKDSKLGYFEPLKLDDPNTTDRKLDEKNGTVDLTLKVKEK